MARKLTAEEKAARKIASELGSWLAIAKAAIAKAEGGE